MRWIVPDGRLTDELGIRIIKYGGKTTLDKGPLTKPIEAIMINGLPYLTWADFAPIRQHLMESHKAGRPVVTVEWQGRKDPKATRGRN